MNATPTPAVIEAWASLVRTEKALVDIARALRAHVDGVIVGSAIINHLKENKPLIPFVKSLRAALGATHARQ